MKQHSVMQCYTHCYQISISVYTYNNKPLLVGYSNKQQALCLAACSTHHDADAQTNLCLNNQLKVTSAYYDGCYVNVIIRTGELGVFQSQIAVASFSSKQH